MFKNDIVSANDTNTAALWVERLISAQEQLLGIAGTTEEEFLATGARLQDFYSRAQQISGMASEMAGKVSGEEITHAIGRLHEILGQMNGYLLHEEQETAQSSQTLQSILQLLDRTATPLSGFRKINKSLRMLGISTKIESSRLGQSAAGFETLANDVAQLSIQVLEKAGTILAQKDLLSGVIRQTLNQVMQLGNEQRRQVGDVLDRTKSGLTSLTQVNSRCSMAATDIADASAMVSTSIGEVVMSMQFHDIVRQQIEHVAEALEDLRHGLDTEGETDPVAAAQHARAICELQEAQLCHARDELNGAVCRIVDNLHGIAAKEARLSEETSAMAGVADQTGSSFLTALERDLDHVGSVLDQSADVNRALAKAMSTVAETVTEIARFVGDIEFIGEEIELIALNAQVKAALTGEEGAALGVLAEAIQRLSVDAMAQTSAVSEMLRGVTCATEGLCDSAKADVSDLDVEVEAMVNSLPELLNTLQAVNNSLSGCLSTMQESVQDLCTDIDRATNGISVHYQVTQVINQVLDELHQVVAEARAIAPASSTTGEQHLDHLAGRYTMDSERKIHKSLVQEVVHTTDTEPPVNGGDLAADDLGANVELF